jgi:hypothetical protein
MARDLLEMFRDLDTRAGIKREAVPPSGVIGLRSTLRGAALLRTVWLISMVRAAGPAGVAVGLAAVVGGAVYLRVAAHRYRLKG